MTVKINYSSFDFATVKADIITAIKADANLKDYNYAGANINTIIEMISSVADLFDVYINANANEPFIRTAELYSNMNKIVELIGYKPKGLQSATVGVNLSGTETMVMDDYFEIPKFTTFTATSPSPDGDTIKYLTTSDITYVGFTGSNTINLDVILTQGEMKTVSFTGTGLNFQKYEIEDLNAIEEYMEVTVDGESWSYVENLYDGIDSNSKVFTTRFNKNQYVEIQFGNGIYGVVPGNGLVIDVKYIKSLGDQGVIGANELTKIDSTIDLIDGMTASVKGTVTLTVTQTTESDGGEAIMDIETIRNIAPGSVRTQNRIVTDSDHKDQLLAGYNNYILDVVPLNSDEYSTLTGIPVSAGNKYYNNIYLYILPRYGNSLSGTLQQEILTYLDTYKMSTINYNLLDVDFRTFNYNVTFKIKKNSLVSEPQMSVAIQNTIRTYFSRTLRKLGEEIKYSELNSELQALDGMSSLTLAVSSDLDLAWHYSNVELDFNQFPELGTMTLAYSGTGD